jgi:hypothetical protein
MCGRAEVVVGEKTRLSENEREDRERAMDRVTGGTKKSIEFCSVSEYEQL